MRASFLSILLLSFFSANSQDTISGIYDKLSLGSNVYVVSGTVSVNNKLTINPGARIFFSEGASVIVNGSVKISGTNNAQVLFKSVPGQKGSGLVIRNNSLDSILMECAHFENLLLPILFDKDWSRNNVAIENCEFVNNKSANALIYVQRPKFNFNQESIGDFTFTLSRNLFSENQSPVYFEDLSNDLMQFIIKENSFVENDLYDYGAYNFSSNIFFGRADKFSSLHKPIITQNSFVNNRLINSSVDTLSQFANFGIYGTDDSISLSNNYWSLNSEKDIKSSLYDYVTNYTSPRVLLSSILKKPSDSAPPHIYAIVNGFIDTLFLDSSVNILNNFSYKVDLSKKNQFLLLSNKLIDFSNAEITWVFQTDSSNSNEKKLKFTWGSQMKSAVGVLKLDAQSLDSISAKNGYIRIDGLIGLQGEYIPSVKIGYINYLKNKFRTNEIHNRKLSQNIDSASINKRMLIPSISKFKKKSEFGVLGMFGWYYGTVSNKKLFKNDVNAGFGIQYRKSFTKYISASLSAYKISLSGSDMRSNDTAKIARGMSFKTPVMGAIISFHYSLKNNLVYGSKTRLIPEISIGAEYIKFNPQGLYKGTWYDLQPLGTAGQTISGSTLKPYTLSSIGVPVSISARLILNKHTVFSFFGQYHFLMTDYLDDIGSDLYVSPTQIQSSNPAYPEAAIYFSNPSNRTLKSGQLRSAIGDANDGFLSLGVNLLYHF